MPTRSCSHPRPRRFRDVRDVCCQACRGKFRARFRTASGHLDSVNWLGYETESSLLTQGPEEMCLLLEHQNPSKTSEKMGYCNRVTVSSHILYTANQETEKRRNRLQ